MTLATYLVPFIVAAIGTATLLTVGVLGAADLLHRPHADQHGDGGAGGPTGRRASPTEVPDDRAPRHGTAA